MYVCYVYGMCSCVWCICVASMCDVYMCVWSVWWLHCVCVCVSMWCVVLSLFFQLRWRIRSSPWDNRDIGGEAIIFQTLKKPPPIAAAMKQALFMENYTWILALFSSTLCSFLNMGFQCLKKKAVSGTSVRERRQLCQLCHHSALSAGKPPQLSLLQAPFLISNESPLTSWPASSWAFNCVFAVSLLLQIAAT